MTHWDFARRQVADLIRAGDVDAARALCDEYRRVMSFDAALLLSEAQTEAAAKK